MKVWREGNRIRNGDGVGYADRVSDGEIWKHIARSVPDKHLTHIEFAVAVLRLRAIERAVAS